MLDVPVEFNAKDFELDHPDIQKVTEIFEELEFRQLLDNFQKTFAVEAEPTSKKIQITEASSSEKPKTKQIRQLPTQELDNFHYLVMIVQRMKPHRYSSRKTAETTSHFYQSVATGMATKLFIKNLMNQTSVCFDTETTGINPITAELVGIAFSWEVGKGFYLPFPENKDDAQELDRAIASVF